MNSWLAYFAPIALLLWAIFLFGGFAFGKPDPYRRMPVWTRMASSFVLVLLSWAIYLTNNTPFTLWMALGMTLGFVGDLYMAHLIPWPQPAVLGGMGSFGLGHIAYIIACLGYAQAQGLTNGSVRWGSWFFWLLVAVIIWYWLIYKGVPAGQRSILHTAALPYALLLASTVGVGTGLALQTAGFWPFTLGAGLFLFSDLLIAVDLFNKKQFYLMGDLIWLTYGPAQALIITTIFWL